MSDLISRKAAIKAIEDLQDCYNGFSDTYDKACIIGALEEVPSAQPEYRMDEWCTDCKEYDHKRHCCPRFNHVIRTTLQEVQEEQRERKVGKTLAEEVERIKREITDIFAEQMDVQPSAQPEIVRCRECKYHDGIRCFRWNSTIITGVDDFCSNGARRGEDERSD